MLPSASSEAEAVLASALWVVSLAGFVVTALSFWGIAPVDLWQPVGVASAIASGVGIVLFFGTWPHFNTLAALAMNVAVIAAILAHWPPHSVFAG